MDCVDGQVAGVSFEGMLREMGDTGSGEELPVSRSVEPSTDIPDCLIWDIVDGSVHIETEGGFIQVFNDPCQLR